jgi:hypothetical protein
MFQYHWKLVFAKDFVAILAALVWALRNYTDTWDHTKSCDPTWHGFLLYVALLIAALTVIEIFSWGIWALRGVFHKRHGQLQMTEERTSLVLVNAGNLKGSLLSFAAGLVLLVLSRWVGGPAPCKPLYGNFWSLSFVLGSIICGLGLLTVANGVIREERPL